MKRRNKSAVSAAVVHSFAPGQPRPPYYSSMTDINLLTRHFVLSVVQQCSKKEDVSFLAAIDAAVHTARSTAQLRQWLTSMKPEEKGGLDDRTIVERLTCTRKDGVMRADDPRPAELEHVQLDSACSYHYATFTVHPPSTVGGGSGSLGSFTMAFATSLEFVEEEEELFAVSVSLPANSTQRSASTLSTAVSSYEYHLLADAAPARKQQHRLIQAALTQLQLPASLFFALMQRAAHTLPADARQRVERHIQLTAAMYKHLHEGGERPEEDGEEEGSEDEEDEEEDDGADLEDFVVADDVVEMDTDVSEAEEEQQDTRKKQRGGNKQQKAAKQDKPKKDTQKEDKRTADKGRKGDRAGKKAESTNGVKQSNKENKQTSTHKNQQNGTKATQQTQQPKSTQQQQQQQSKAEQLVHSTSKATEEQPTKQSSPTKQKRKRDEQQSTGSSSSTTSQSTTVGEAEGGRTKKAKKGEGKSEARANSTQANSSNTGGGHGH